MIDFTSNLLDDKHKAKGVYAFSQAELFDRIINLKLYTRATGSNAIQDEYVIRSDWELYYPDLLRTVQHNGTAQDIQKCYVRRCVQKPSIKVQYKQIATGTAIEIDIFISNFIMLSSDGRTLMSFNNLTYPLGMVEVQMGYFGQFNRKPSTIAEYFDFTKNPNADTLTVDVGEGYVQTDKLPPDGVLHIHGYVGSCYVPPVTAGKFLDTYDKVTGVAKPFDDFLQNYLFTNVTRRFVRKPLMTKANLAKLNVDETSGLIDWGQADTFGVHVYLSDKLEQRCKAVLDKTIIDAEGHEIAFKDTQLVGHYSESVVKALNLVRDELGIDMSFKALTNGDFIAYLAEEAVDTDALVKSLAKYKIEGKMNLMEAGSVVTDIYHNVLPAVENITTDALCTIVCPFFYFLNPFDMVKFKSRYALGGVVSYYANFTVEESKFYALYMTVSFATVDDINECNIVCTGSREN